MEAVRCANRHLVFRLLLRLLVEMPLLGVDVRGRFCSVGGVDGRLGWIYPFLIIFVLIFYVFYMLWRLTHFFLSCLTQRHRCLVVLGDAVCKFFIHIHKRFWLVVSERDIYLCTSMYQWRSCSRQIETCFLHVETFGLDSAKSLCGGRKVKGSKVRWFVTSNGSNDLKEVV